MTGTNNKISLGDLIQKEHAIPAIWGLILLVVGLIIGQFVTLFGGPSEVVVRNVDQFSIKEEVPIAPPVATLDLASREELAKLREALIAVKTTADEQSSAEANRAEENIRRLEAKIDELEVKQQVAELAERSAPRVEHEAAKTEIEGEKQTVDAGINFNELVADWNRTRLVYRPEFKLPDNVKGYRLYAPRYLSQPSCPNEQLWDNTHPKIGFRFANLSEQKFISPLIVTIARVDAPLKLYQVFSEQYHIEPGANSLELDITLQPANYVLEFGYYIRSEVNEEYPKQYAFQCKFEVIERQS